MTNRRSAITLYAQNKQGSKIPLILKERTTFTCRKLMCSVSSVLVLGMTLAAAQNCTQ